ncbi:unnamed protein product [Closterium sp. NIES-54]
MPPISSVFASHQTTQNEIRELLKECGEIRDVRMVFNHSTGQFRGFAYVELASAEAVAAAEKLNRTPLRGRQVSIKKSDPSHGSGHRDRGRGRGRGWGGGVGGGGRGRGGGREGHDEAEEEGKQPHTAAIATAAITTTGTRRKCLSETRAPWLSGRPSLPWLIIGLFFPLLIVSAVFFLETVSVMLQVSFFKLTKRITGTGLRLFRMSPFHHHLELSGMAETTVVMLAYIATFLAGAAAVWVALISV